MDKVILTVEQDKIIKEMLKNSSRDRLMNYHGKGFVDGNKQCLNDLLPSQMAKVLYLSDGYEVEQPKFKVGEWAFWNDPMGRAKKPFILKSAFGDEKFFPDKWPPPYCGGEALKPSELRRATNEEIRVEKERRFWAELGREVGEFRIGDLEQLESGEMYPVTNIKSSKKRYEIGSLTGFHPAESFKPFPKDDES